MLVQEKYQDKMEPGNGAVGETQLFSVRGLVLQGQAGSHSANRGTSKIDKDPGKKLKKHETQNKQCRFSSFLVSFSRTKTEQQKLNNHNDNKNNNNNNNNNGPTPRPRALLPSWFPLELRWNVYFHSLQAVFSSLVCMQPSYCKNHHILMIGSCFFVQYLHFFDKKSANM